MVVKRNHRAAVVMLVKPLKFSLLFEIQSVLSITQFRIASLESIFQALSIGLSISLVEVKVGQEFNITLDSNPTTGH